MNQSAPWPTELKLNARKTVLSVRFDTDEHYELAAEYLRVELPSAEVQGHGAGQRTTVGGKQNVAIRALEPVGNYAVRIVFDDGHDTGLYTWSYLHELGEKHHHKWRDYLDELARAGLTRG